MINLSDQIEHIWAALWRSSTHFWNEDIKLDSALPHICWLAAQLSSSPWYIRMIQTLALLWRGNQFLFTKITTAHMVFNSVLRAVYSLKSWVELCVSVWATFPFWWVFCRNSRLLHDRRVLWLPSSEPVIQFLCFMQVWNCLESPWKY